MNIPDTLISTEMKSLLPFVKRHKKVISKTLNTGFFQYKLNDKETIDIASTTKLLTENEIEEMSVKKYFNEFTPSMFQQYIDKNFELRIFYFFEELYPMAIFSQQNEKTKIYFRNYDYVRPNRT